MYTKHETKSCPRCEASFECKSGSILLCQCQTVILNADQIEYMNMHYEDCLCARCLLEVRTECNCMQHTDKLNKIIGFKEKHWMCIVLSARA